MWPLIAGGAALVGGTFFASRAAKKAAQAERRQALENVESSLPTAQELEQQRLMLENQKRQVSFTEAQLASLGDLLASISPVLAEGFNQQMMSMRGLNVGPISRQIDIERQQNLNRQIASMGGGASSSSAGMMADALFGQQAGMARLQEQQALGQMNAQNAQILSALMGTGAQLGLANQNISTQISSIFDALKRREMSARQGLVGTAGALQAGNLMIGQALQGIGSSVIGSAAGAWANNYFGKPKMG